MNAQKILFGLSLLAVTFTSNAQVWNQVTVPTQERLNDIQFVDDQIGFIVGENGTILKTTDGGESWVQPAVQGIPNVSTSNFIDIDMLDALNGFLSINNSMSIYQTNDGGVNWTSVPNNNTNQCFPRTIHAVSMSDFFVGGSDCFQGATINQVVSGTWNNQTVNYQTFDTQHYIVDFDFEGSLGLAAVNNEYFLRTTDGGITWDSINSDIGNGHVLTSVMIASNDTCYAGYNQNGSGFGILFSADDGQTWQEDMSSATFFYPAFYGATENNAGKVYMSAVPSTLQTGLIFEQNGSSWMYYDVAEEVYAMDSYGDDVTWAVGANGYVVVNQDISSVSVPEIEKTGALKLYPNPVKSTLNWDCDNCSIEGIRILNTAGQQMEGATKSTSGTDVSDLPGGIYILEIRTKEGVTNSKFVKE